MHVVDTQLHLNRMFPHWPGAATDDVIHAAIACMDAVGVDGAIICESRRNLSGEALPGGGVRGDWAFSARAVALYPDRFAYQLMVDPRDTQFDRIVAGMHERPGAVGLRVNALDNQYHARFESGGYRPLFTAAERHAAPIVLLLPRRPEIVEAHLKAFPGLTLILDHCGVGNPPSPEGQTYPPELQAMVSVTLAERRGEFEQVLALSRYPNLFLKWSEAPSRLSSEAYPYPDALGDLRRAIDAFGADRILWGSDYSETRDQLSWAQSLHYFRDSGLFTNEEKAWILGGSARRALKWRVDA